MTVKFKDSSTTEKMLANRKMIRFSGVLVGTLVLIFTGCQTDKLVVNDQSFTTLWSAYDHCQSSADLDAMRVDVKRLEEGSQTAQDNTLSVKHDQAQPSPHSERTLDRLIDLPSLGRSQGHGRGLHPLHRTNCSTVRSDRPGRRVVRLRSRKLPAAAVCLLCGSGAARAQPSDVPECPPHDWTSNPI